METSRPNEVEPKTANAVLYACNVCLLSIRTDEQEKRLDELEKRVEEMNTKRHDIL